MNIYINRDAILYKSKLLIGIQPYSEFKYHLTEEYNIANKIISGGYILFFRHAEREKWIDVTMYDYLESNKDRFGENEDYERAVCLSDRGKIQAKTMGEIFRDISVPIETVITSPSCRARQTANLVFGGYDQINDLYLNRGPFYEDEKDVMNTIKKELTKLNVPQNKNIIISGHNGVIDRQVLDEIKNDITFTLEEGGFYVIENKDGKLILLNKFHNFQDFYRNFNFREY